PAAPAVPDADQVLQRGALLHAPEVRQPPVQPAVLLGPRIGDQRLYRDPPDVRVLQRLTREGAYQIGAPRSRPVPESAGVPLAPRGLAAGRLPDRRLRV